MSARRRHHEAPARLITCRATLQGSLFGRGILWAMRSACRWALGKGYTVLYITNEATKQLIIAPMVAAMPAEAIECSRFLKAPDMGAAHDMARTWPADTRGPLWIVYVHA